MKGFYYISYPSFLGHNPKNILTFFLFDFDNDCYYSYNSQKSNFESKLKDNKTDKIYNDFDELVLEFGKMRNINVDRFIKNKHVYHENALKYIIENSQQINFKIIIIA